MSAELKSRIWMASQPLAVMEGYLFRVSEYGKEAAGKWLMQQYLKAQT